MRPLRLASALLVAVALALSTGARAAPGFPHAIAPGVAHADYRLVQYGGGGNDDDDEPRARPQPRPHNNGGGGGNGAAIMLEILKGVGSAIQQQKQRELQQRNNELQRRAIEEQNRRNRAVEEQNRRNRIQDERNRRARQEELDRLRREQQAERDRLKKLEEQRKEEAQRLNEQKAAEDKRKKQEDAVLQEEREQKQRDQAYNNEPYEPGEQLEDKLENNVPVVIVVVPHDDRPDIDKVEPLYINKNTQLPACGYVTLPADRELCTGRTVGGGWLRIASVPTATGGTRSVCVSYCPPASRPKIPERRPKLVERVVPPPAPAYVPPVTPPPYQPVAPSYQPMPAPAYVPPPKPVTPAVQTAKADPYVEPAPRRPLTPAVTTAEANPYVEPEPRRKPTPAVTTAEANPYVEPEPRRKPTPAVTTAEANPYVEPEPRRKPTPAVNTAEANPYVEPKPRRKPTPAVNTAEANPYVEPEREPEQEPKRGEQEPLTPAVQTVSASPYIQPASNRPPVTPAVQTVAAHPYTQPGPKEPDVKPDEPAFDFDSIEPGPQASKPEPVDAKGCTAAGVRPLGDALSKPLANFHSPAFSPREVVTTVLSGIPAVEGIPLGGIISGVTKMFWKDDRADQLFDSMKKYVDGVVPAAINKYDATQLNNDLSAIRGILSKYDNYWTPSTKGEQLDLLVAHLDAMKPRFLNPQSPKSTLAEFVAFGTLHLAALRELYDHYDQYHPFDAKNAEEVKRHEHDRREVMFALNDAIKEYKDHVKAIRSDIIADRLSKLRVQDNDENETETYVGDLGNTWINVVKAADLYSAKDDSCDWQGPDHRNDEASAKRDVDARKEAVTKGYNKVLDEMTKPLTQWPPVCDTAMQIRNLNAFPVLNAEQLAPAGPLRDDIIRRKQELWECRR